MAVELELGATEDPRALVLGDPDALAAAGRHLTDLAAAFGRTADGLTRVGTGRWRGEAADAFRARFPDVTAEWAAARLAFEHAARSWDDYRGAVVWAQDQAVEAVRQYREGVAASESAIAARAEAEVRHDAEARAFEAGRGPAPAPLGPFTDPGAAAVARARAVLDGARRRRDEVAGGVAATLAAATGTAPEVPAFWEELVADAQDRWGALVDDAGRAASGFGEGVEGLVKTVRAVDPFDPWNAANPVSSAARLSGAAAGVIDATVHPLRLLGTGWADDPARAAGRLAPTFLAAYATRGAGEDVAAAGERAAMRPPGRPRSAEPPPVPGPGVVSARTGSLHPSDPRSGRTIAAGQDGRVAPVPPPPVRPGPLRPPPPARPVPPGADSPTGRVVVRMPRRPDPVPRSGPVSHPDPVLRPEAGSQPGPILSSTAGLRPGPAPQPDPVTRPESVPRPDPAPPSVSQPRPLAAPSVTAAPTPAVDPPPSAPSPVGDRVPRQPGRTSPSGGPSLDEADAAAAQRFRDIPTPFGQTILEGLGMLPPRPPLPPTEIQFLAPVPRVGADPVPGPALPPAAAPIRDADGLPRVPAGFADEAAFRRFGAEIRDGLTAAGHDDVRIYFAGSSVSGVSFKAGVPFDTGRVSDYDIALASRGLLRRAKAIGVEARGNGARTAPLTLDQADRLGIGDLQRRLTAEAGRPVYFMIYSSDGAVQARAATIEVIPR